VLSSLVSWQTTWRFVGVAVRASRLLSAVAAGLVVLAAAAPLGAVAAIGVVVGTIPVVASGGLDSAAGRMAVWWALAAAALLFVQWMASAFQARVAIALGERVDAVLQRELMAAVLAPEGIGHLEDPRTRDLLDVGRETFRAVWARPGRLAAALTRFAANRVLLIGACVLVARFRPVLGVALLAVTVWAAYEDKRASRVEAAHHYGTTELARRTTYFYDLAVTPPAAKEIRVFGLSGFLLDRFSQAWQRAMVGVLAPASRRPLVSTAALGVVVLVGLAWIAREAVAGGIEIGAAAVYAQALMLGLDGMRQSSWASLQTELALATLRRYEEAAAAVQPPVGGLGTTPADGMPRAEIRFQGVGFSYPSGAAEALHDLDLVIPAGRSLAVVGANGAGKTTLVKLLCRMYAPTAGVITVDGVDVAALDPSSWRRRLAAVFQDSTRFELPARTNVEFGRIHAAGDQAGIEAAAATAGVDGAIDGLRNGWDTPLSSAYAGGTDLSGGEWQKVGLARALFGVRHGATVLILDEPAAHLDARAEAQLYERFLAMTEGLTTIVISHRFSTVRQASSIVVLDGGRLVEHGSHDELMARDGAYATMFRLQAARFVDPVDEVGPVGAGQGAAATAVTEP
jgi:ATP-binding cassette, subfamily B, bacterial